MPLLTRPNPQTSCADSRSNMDLSCKQRILFLLVLGLVQHAFAQNTEVKFTSTATAPKNSSVGVSFTSTQQGSAAADSANGAQAAVDAVHQHIAQALARVGITPEAQKALTDPLKASTHNLLAGLDAVRSAYEKTLTSFYGMLLDNTKELRKTLEDGNAVIDTIHELQGAECEDPSFKPPTANPARIKGFAGTYEVTTGTCQLVRDPAPLQLDYVLTCTEPGISVSTEAPRYTSRFVSAAAATTEECKATRKYGVESTTTITLYDPAAFFATAAPEATASAGPANNATNGLNKGAAWYQALFPLQVEGMTGKKVNLMPAGVTDAVLEAIKNVQVNATFDYKPFNLRNHLQDAADNLVATLSKKLEVTQKKLQMFKDKTDYWLDPETEVQISKNLDFQGNLREAMSKMNITRVFDGTFSKKAATLLTKGPLAGKVGKGQMATAAAAAAKQLISEQPLRTLLQQARKGTGEPISMKLNANMEQIMKLGGADGALGETLSRLQKLGAGGNMKPGSLLSMLNKDPQFGQRIKQLADVLGAAANGMRKGFQESAAGKQAMG